MIEHVIYKKNSTDNLRNKVLRCSNSLILSGSFVDNLGLGNGKMGIAIFFFHYSRYTHSKQYEEYAEELIDEIFEELNLSIPLNFETGLTGIGWGIEYLSVNGFIEGDTDEILDEIDLILANRLNEFLPEDQNEKKKEFGYNLYEEARNKTMALNDDEILSLIKRQKTIDEIFTVSGLINSGNYGLFRGIAGEGFLSLNELQKTESS